jgi:hypothetical protein
MNKDTLLRNIIIGNIYPIIVRDAESIVFPKEFQQEDKMEYLDYVISYLEKFEEYDKCDEVVKIKSKLKEVYEQGVNK